MTHANERRTSGVLGVCILPGVYRWTKRSLLDYNEFYMLFNVSIVVVYLMVPSGPWPSDQTEAPPRHPQ